MEPRDLRLETHETKINTAWLAGSAVLEFPRGQEVRDALERFGGSVAIPHDWPLVLLVSLSISFQMSFVILASPLSKFAMVQAQIFVGNTPRGRLVLGIRTVVSVVYPCLSSSSDDHLLSHSCLGTGMRFGTQNKFCHYRASLVHLVSLIVS